MIYRFIILFLLLIPTGLAANIYQYETLTLEQEINNDILIKPKQSNYIVEDFKINLHLYPETDHRQDVIQTTTTPNSATSTFIWNRPTDKVLSLQTNFVVETSAKPKEISEKIPFPLESVPLEVEEYLQTTEFIDINNEIKTLAQQLAQGEDDLYLLEHKLARWVNKNIEYNLSTITAEANQPSSLVIEQRYGVCDELTNLFISLNRALGIPARFVSGIAYSDSILFDTKWGNHGWAEVYFPGHGWIPYDVTYQEYGFVDATHIALDKEVDGGDPSIEYYSRGLYFEFEPQLLEFNTEVLETGNTLPLLTNIELDIEENTIGFGSYNLITATVKNTKPYYIVQDVTLVPVEDMITVSQQRQSVALKPFEEQTMSWLVQVKDSLNVDFIYTFPISIIPHNQDAIEDAFSVQAKGEMYSKAYMEQFISETQSTSDSSILCTARDKILVGEEVIINCTTDESIIRTCLGTLCKDGKEVSFVLTGSEVGITTKKIIGVTKSDNVQSFVTYKVSDIAHITIDDLTIVEETGFGEIISLEATVRKNSSANPTDVTITLTHPTLEQEWYFSEFDENKRLAIDVPTDAFVLGENTFTLTVTYTNNDETIIIFKEATTTLTDLSFDEKAIATFNTYSAGIKSMLEPYIKNKEQLQTATSLGIAGSLILVVTLLQFIIGKIINLRRN